MVSACVFGPDWSNESLKTKASRIAVLRLADVLICVCRINACVCFCPHLSQFVRICLHLSAFVCVCPRLSISSTGLMYQCSVGQMWTNEDKSRRKRANADKLR